MTAPTTTHSDSDRKFFFNLLARFHGHRCPMSILGARLGLAARAHVGRHGEDGDVAAIYHHRTCAIDGIQLALGTTSGNQNIEVLPEGDHRLDATNKTKRMYITLSLTDAALARGREYSELKKGGGDQKELDAILIDLEEAPDDVLIEVEARI